MTVFLDTSGLIAVANADDQWHEIAESIWSDITNTGRALVTTSLVFIELADGLSRIHQRDLAVQIAERLKGSDRVEVVQTDRSLEDRAWTLYRNRQDKEWGMTDCVSMTLLSDRNIRDVLTGDHHFRQAGFNILLDTTAT